MQLFRKVAQNEGNFSKKVVKNEGNFLEKL